MSMTGKALLVLAIAGATAASASDGERWWAHVRYLADDGLEGRETGSEGYRKAVAYVARELESVGLRPAGERGYLQTVAFRSRSIVEERSRLALRRDGELRPLALGDDAYFNMRVDPAPRLEAGLVFVGYGLTVPEAGHDDLGGVDLAGKVAVYFTGGPESVPGPLLAHYQSAGERWAFLRKAGAIGALAIQNPRGQDVPWERAKLARLKPALALAEPGFDETAGQRLSVTVNPERAAALFAGSGHEYAPLLAAARERKPLPRFRLPASVVAEVAVETAEVRADNVIALWPGADAKLKDEYVVLSAHLDHVGVGEPIGGDALYNGAMDNASGIATLIETARALKESGARPARSIVFAAVTAEEKGLLGSRYFAARPTVPAAAIVANLNTDMFGPHFPLKSLIVQGLDESDLGDELRRQAGALGVEVLPDPEPERNAFTRSDQYSFIRRGVPALSLKVGFAKDSKEHEIVKKWRRERYHAPSDDLDQPVDLQAAADFNRVYAKVVEAVANKPQRPRWHEKSFFKRFAAPGAASAPAAAQGPVVAVAPAPVPAPKSPPVGPVLALVKMPYRGERNLPDLSDVPDYLEAGGLADRLRGLGARLAPIAEARLSEDEKKQYGEWNRLGLANGRLGRIVAESRRQGGVPIGLLANCSSILGMLGGLQHSGPGSRPLRVGLVFIDAHGDFNTPETTLSGMLGGMPVAVAAGLGLERLRLRSGLDPALPTRYIVLAGVRDTDPLEQELIDRSQVQLLSVADLRARSEALHAQMRRLSELTDLVYVHVDMDVLDPAEVRGHPLTVPDGPTSRELAAAIEEMFGYPKAAAFGVASTPSGERDPGGVSRQAAYNLVEGALRGLQRRATASR